MSRVLARTGIVLSVIVVLLAAAVIWANLPYSQLPAGARADRIVVLKSVHEMRLYQGNQVLASYPIAIGHHPVGPKLQQGDGKTPEGLYSIDYHKPDSSFYRSLHISYPNSSDWARSAANNLDPGGQIMIHGVPPRYRALGRLTRLFDWTDGCIAVTDPEMEQIFTAVPDGTPIEIRP